MVKQKELFVYGMEFGRFEDKWNRRLKVDPMLLVDFLAMPPEVREDFIEELDDEPNVNPHLSQVFSAIETELSRSDKRKLMEGKPFYVMTEETGHGFGYTPEQAEAAFTRGERENGCDLEGDNNDW